MTPAHLRVGDDALHAAIDHGFYARPATFYRVYEDMFAAARGPYTDQGHAYFPLDYENLVRAYRLDAVNDAHVRMLKRHPTLTYRYRRVNVVKAAAFLVYPTSVYNRDTDKLIRNIERHLRANLTIDNGIYTNKNRGNRVFSSEKFHMVHALSRGARFADFAAPTVGVLLGNRPTPKTCPRPTPYAALLQAWWDALAKEVSEDMCFPPARSPRPRAPRKRKQDSCARPTPDDALLRTWRNALADLPDDMSERPREKRRAPPRTRPNRRRQDICPRATPDDALLQAWRDALAKKSEGVCKNRLGKTTAQLAQETMRQKSARVTLADKRRHADRVAAKANLYARGARIRTEATGGR